MKLRRLRLGGEKARRHRPGRVKVRDNTGRPWAVIAAERRILTPVESIDQSALR